VGGKNLGLKMPSPVKRAGDVHVLGVGSSSPAIRNVDFNICILLIDNLKFGFVLGRGGWTLKKKQIP